MALTIPVTWSESHRLHAPETAVWVGVPIEADELPVRADRIRAELEDAGAPVVDAVLALGVDADIDDPNAPLAVTADGLREAGRRLGTLGLRTVVVQEGGYVLDTVGPLVRAALEGLEAGRSA